MDLRLDDARQAWHEVRRGCGRQLQIVEKNRAGELRTLTHQQPRLQTHERHGRIGAHRLPERHAGIAVESRGHIERKHRSAARVDGADHLRELRLHGPLEPRTQQGIHDDFACGELLGRKGVRRTAARPEILVRLARVAAQLLRGTGAEHRHRKPCGVRKARQHVTVTGVVAAPTDDDDAVGHRPARAQVAQRRLAGAFHERVARDPELIDRMGIEGPHLGGGIQSVRQRHEVIILTRVVAP